MPRPSASRPFRPSAGTVLLCTVVASLSLLPAGSLRAESFAKPRVLAGNPSADATPAAISIDATDLGSLQAHLNEQVEIHGQPTAASHNRDGSVLYLNFGAAHQALSLVFFLKNFGGESGKAISEDDLKPFVGKPITIHGQLTAYKGDVQIIVKSLDQIRAAP